MKNNLLAFFFIISTAAIAQKKNPDNWPTLDPTTDHVYGTGIEEAYKTLAGKTPQPIIVAVIDGGVDIYHEDLKDIIWTNPGEIPDNGIDDDKNGYIDDVHGWNFLGGKNGDINFEAPEISRMYHKMNKKFKNADMANLSADDQKEFKEFDKIRTEFISTQEQQEQELQGLTFVYDFIEKVKTKNAGVLTKDALKNYKAENELEKQVQDYIKHIFFFVHNAKDLEEQVKGRKDELSHSVEYDRLDADSVRAYVVGDDPNNPNERYYGNNHVKGPDASHGSHVSGIIAAIRNNGKGINGQANNVKIMMVRAVPDGDERDKDIANSIRYAVDNGAKVINMSFGKYYSPDKKVVDDAVEYALSKDVLLVHASGNESKNKDVEMSYPCRELLDGTIASNWIEVGASAAYSGKNIIGDFSNYGKTTMDLFAPGVDIYSTVPDTNKYATESGTSMASPATAGVAAVIREYFPELSAADVRKVLMNTVATYNKKVNVPGMRKNKILKFMGTKPVKMKVNELCISGGFVNANNAVKEVMKTKK